MIRTCIKIETRCFGDTIGIITKERTIEVISYYIFFRFLPDLSTLACIEFFILTIGIVGKKPSMDDLMDFTGEFFFVTDDIIFDNLLS